ncbi:MAG: cation transporter [Firmicutes bacterium]|nr:cation transporter [Bacillota bacterium]MBQ9603946.1 cation transporter [Bacillota bacterium]
MDREKIIVRTSYIGIAVNVLLSVFKAAVGLVSGSLSVVLDAVNNLSDAVSSVVTVIGAKLANKTPNKKHPLGYGRIEYFSAAIVAAIVFYAGATSLSESVKEIFNPEKPDYSIATLVIVGTAVIVKLILGKYVMNMGKKVDSSSLTASGADALFDAVLSLSVLICALICKFTGIKLEAYVGIIISLFILKASIEMLSDTVSDLLGRRLEPELVSEVKNTICEDEAVMGAYDLILHNYGPDRLIGSVHIEVPADMTAAEIDLIERRIFDNVAEKHNILLAGIGIYSFDDKHSELRDKIIQTARKHDGVLQIHAFFADEENKKLRFDLVLDYELENRHERFEEIKRDICCMLPDWDIDIAIDIDI